jgi:predicted metal-dependent HD superfamily phosphohydrolase
MDYRAARSFALKKLRTGLNAHFVYHTLDHTLDVVEAARRLAGMEKISPYETRLLLTAALYHDLGFTVSYADHENHSVRILKEALPSFGYTPEEIGIISNMIRATRVPQKPATQLERILVDSDLDYLGREDFFVIGQRLHHEWNLNGRKISLRDWFEMQREYLRMHDFFTASAKKLRDQVKRQNLRELEGLLGVKQGRTR